MINKDFFKGKTILITGHTGFKGSWLCRILLKFKANVIGYSLLPPTNPNLYDIAEIDDKIISIIGDIRDYKKLLSVFEKYKPELVIHLAAQPIVRYSYSHPLETYETNVMGTANILECIRETNCVKSFLNVTTDKVYLNNDLYDHAFKEDEPLDGYDPYSNSKSCSELVTHSYLKSFFSERDCSISTARAGNVIGGGDFAENRIIPDCVKSALKQETIIVRNPHSTRPYQHVLEPLFMYLEIIEKQYENKKYQGNYNVGPDECDCVSTGELVNMFCNIWGENCKWNNVFDGGPHEANFLKLSNEKIKQVFKWHPVRHIEEALTKTIERTRVYSNNIAMVAKEMDRQIDFYLGENK